LRRSFHSELAAGKSAPQDDDFAGSCDEKHPKQVSAYARSPSIALVSFVGKVLLGPKQIRVPQTPDFL
jgi:hypothetical protein